MPFEHDWGGPPFRDYPFAPFSLFLIIPSLSALSIVFPEFHDKKCRSSAILWKLSWGFWDRAMPGAIIDSLRGGCRLS